MMSNLGSPTDHLATDFAMRFTSTPRGARLARRLVGVRLQEWGMPYGTDAHDNIVLITAELAANAVRHGHVAVRDFRVQLSLLGRTARIEVSDTRGERVPPRSEELGEPGLSDGGRGLVLVSRLATAWDWYARGEGLGKVVWAEYATATSSTTTTPPSAATR
ncbi:ATP-binding protein [Streptomyces griseoluteus]|uniref:ATP-binding protein n=1 Tax=Streptomyces griseoluteus TaxID=29306 RepID=UPI003701E819